MSQEKNVKKAVFSIQEACQIMGVGKTKAYQEIAQGRLVARKCGVRTLILADDLKAWLRNLPAITNLQGR